MVGVCYSDMKVEGSVRVQCGSFPQLDGSFGGASFYLQGIGMAGTAQSENLVWHINEQLYAHGRGSSCFPCIYSANAILIHLQAISKY